MKKSFKKLVTQGFLTSLVLSIGASPVAVLASEEASESASSEVVSEESSEEDDGETSSAEESEERDESSEGETSAKLDFSEFVDPLLEVLTPASHELMYESKEPIEHATEDGKLVSRVDGYQYYVIEDFEYNYKQLFDDQTEKAGFVVLHLTIENNSDEPVYHGNQPSFSFPDYDSLVQQNIFGGTDQEELQWDSTDQLLEPGDSKSGYFFYVVKPDQIQALEDIPVIQLEVPGFRKDEDFNQEGTILDSKQYPAPFSDDQDEEVASRGDLLPDKILEDNMGTKELIKDVKVKDAYITVDEVKLKVGFDSYQVSSFVPNAAYEESVQDFEDGVIVINIPLQVTNEGWEDGIDISSVFADMTIDNLVEVTNNNFFEVRPETELLEVGETGTYYLTYTIDGSLYKKFEDAEFTISPRLSDGEFRSLDLYDEFIEVTADKKSE